MASKKSRKHNMTTVWRVFGITVVLAFTVLLLLSVESSNGLDEDFLTNLATEALGITITLLFIDSLRKGSDTSFQEATKEINEQFEEQTTRLITQLEDESRATLKHLEMQSKKIDETLTRRRGIMNEELERFRAQIREIREDLSERVANRDDLVQIEDDDIETPTKPSGVTTLTETEEFKAIRRDIEMIRKILAGYLPRDTE